MIGRLAVDERFQKRGLGAAMLAEAAVRAINADTVAFALLAEAKTDAAARFYQRHGFLTFVSRPATLYLPLATAKKAMPGDAGEDAQRR
jgi:ribosomal protein S18 acetylase RimI-like enzyme